MSGHQKGNDVEQAHEVAEPGEHELAMVAAGRRRGNLDNVVHSSK